MKRKIVLVLFPAILLQIFFLPVYSTDTMIKGEAEIEFVSALNIIGSWDASEAVTRAEFANAVIRCIMKNSGAKDSTVAVHAQSDVFLDVPAAYWASYNLDIAKKNRIISGTEEGTFEPEAYLSYEAALKIAVNALGYAPVAEQNGGFPSGYFIAANRIQIGLESVANREILTKGEAAILLQNILETVPMEYIYHQDGAEGVMPQADGDTILNTIYSIRSFTGVVIANRYSSVNSTDTVDDDKVRIESVSTGQSAMFNIGETKANDYLGRRVIVYYYDETPYELFRVTPDDKNILAIDVDDIIQVSKNEREIKYEVNGSVDEWAETRSERSVKLPADADIIHNGIFTGNVEEIFDIINGDSEANLDTIVFYDNNNDNRFDVVEVKSYFTLHVDYVSDSEERLSFSDNVTGKSVIIDKTNNDVLERRYTADGYEMPGYGITEDCCVSVSYAKGSVELYNLYVSRESRSDTISSVTADTLQSVAYTYSLSNTLLQYLQNYTSGLSQMIQLGTEYDLYMDHKGKVAGYYAKETGYDSYYGIIDNKDDFLYILDARAENGLFKNAVIYFKVVTLEAEGSTMTSADTLKINGRMVKNGTSGLSADAAAAMVKGKLVKYIKDSDGCIQSITLPKTETTDNIFSYTTGLNQEEGPVELTYRASPRVFFNDGVGAVGITSNTTILWVPHNDLIEQGIDASLYCKRGKISDFTSDQKYYVNAYKVNASSIAADILVAYDNDEYRIDSFAKPVIVSEVRGVLNTSGEQALEIYGIQQDREVEIASEDEAFKNRYGDIVSVEPGDLVRCELNARGDCDVVEVLFDYSDYAEVTSSYSSSYRAMRGSVYQHDANNMLLIKNKWELTDNDVIPANMEMHICSSSAKIYMFDTVNHIVTKVSSGSLVDYKFDTANYSRVVVANSYATPDIIIIYE